MIAPATPAAAQGALDLHDIQGLILNGYRRMRRATHLLLHVEDAGAFRTWLGTLTEENLESPYVTVAADWIHKPPAGVPPKYCVNIAFTFSGLETVGVAAGHLETFPDDFRQGAVERAPKASDTGPNDPRNWIEALRAEHHAKVHVVLSVFAVDDAVLRDTRSELLAGAGAAVTLIFERSASTLYDDDGRAGIVHFGYRDGLSQPTIAGTPDYRPEDAERIRDPLAPLPAGDFLLGPPGRRGKVDRTPSPRVLARNGTYAAFRILEQDVVGFERFLAEQANSSAERELLAAKLCGRWRSGTPLVMAPDADAEVPTANLNGFDFADEYPDPAGRRCPLQSHIRRTNPRRDKFAPGDSSLRRIIRRGMPYGPRYDPTQPDPGAERGLVGLFICGNLTEQYEFVMRLWINDGDVAGGHTRDPLTGNIDAAHDDFTAPGDPPVRIDGLPRFVTTRGGLYLFLPGRKALQHLAGKL
jgi:Dyp-type peroxidase family